jgi:hypothetical protein
LVVAKPVKTLRLQKIIGALAMLLFFTFGAATLAHELEPVGSLAQLDLTDCLKRAPVQMDPEDFTVGVQLDPRNVPRCSSSDLVAQRTGGTKLATPLPARIPAEARAAKLSLHIDDCVLLL